MTKSYLNTAQRFRREGQSDQWRGSLQILLNLESHRWELYIGDGRSIQAVSTGRRAESIKLLRAIAARSDDDLFGLRRWYRRYLNRWDSFKRVVVPCRIDHAPRSQRSAGKRVTNVRLSANEKEPRCSFAGSFPNVITLPRFAHARL